MAFRPEKWVEVNLNKKLPLASTVKIIVATEYAQQGHEGVIDLKQTVNLNGLK